MDGIRDDTIVTKIVLLNCCSRQNRRQAPRKPVIPAKAGNPETFAIEVDSHFLTFREDNREWRPEEGHPRV